MGTSETKENDINTDPVTTEYFKNLQVIFLHNYLENDSLISNMRVCLDEKNFDQVIDENNIQNESDELYQPGEFINWIDYLYLYLEDEKNKNRYWAGQMIDLLDEEYFVTENKYQSQFFYEEYGILSEPDCIKQKPKKKKIINVNSSMLNVTQNLGGSFGESYKDENQDEAGLKYKEYRNKVKQYIFIFKEHILNKDHPINKVSQIFEKVWVSFVQNKMVLLNKNFNDYSEESLKYMNKEVGEITYQFQKFVIRLQICLKLFYSRTINYSCFNEEKDELINLITTLIFRTGKIYETMFSLYKLSLESTINDMTYKYRTLAKILPEELGIKKQFCLNKETLDLQEQILQKHLKEISSTPIDLKKNNKDLNLEKGAVEIDLREKKMENRKITALLALVEDKKRRCPKFGDREAETIKVNLDFRENEEIIMENKDYKNDSLELDNNVLGSILPGTDMGSFNIKSVNVSVDNIVDPHNNNKLTINDYDDEEEEILTNKKKNKKEEKKEKIEENLFDDYRPSDLNKTYFIIRDSNVSNKNVIPFVPEKIFNRVSFIRTGNDDYLSYPYETAIELLKQIRKYKTPFEKMMIIASISNEITDCINDFWADMDQYIKYDFLNIEAEQIMTIFIYIVIKSGITDIAVHCKMIKLFTTCITKTSMIGYYYSTVEASISYIQTLKNIQELFQNKGKNKIFGTDV